MLALDQSPHRGRCSEFSLIVGGLLASPVGLPRRQRTCKGRSRSSGWATNSNG